MLVYQRLESSSSINTEQRKKNLQVYFCNFSILILISCSAVTMCLIPITYAKMGHFGMGEITISAFYLCSVFGILVFQILLRKLNYRPTLFISGLCFCLITACPMVTTYCKTDKKLFYCRRNTLYYINIVGMVLGGLIGSSFVMTISSYINYILPKERSKKSLFMIVAVFFCSHTIGLAIASIVLHILQPHLMFLIITTICLSIIVTDSLSIGNILTEQLPNNNIREYLRNLFSLFKNQESIHIILFSFFNGLFQSNFVVILYRLLLPSLMGVQKSKRALYETGSMIFFGIGGLIISIFCFIFFKKKSPIWFLGAGYFFILIQTIIMNLAIVLDAEYYIIALAYFINGIALALLKVALLKAIFQNEDNIMEMVTAFRLSHCLGLAFGSFIGFVFVSIKIIVIFSTIYIFILVIVFILAKKFKFGYQEKDINSF